jgi:predicted molibdopterin-dependent oxidoreductase YjgC
VAVQPAEVVELRVDGAAVMVRGGATLLEACDKASRYVPRLCFYPGLACCSRLGAGGAECGLCAVRLGEGSVVLACATLAAPEMKVYTDDPGLRALRLERLALILARHPHICLTCSDRDGCTRDECTYGNPPEARCCDEFGLCELGKLAEYIDSGLALQPSAVAVSREVTVEGRIQREPGLCVGCGRCVTVCETLPEAGGALELARVAAAAPGSDDSTTARPKLHTLRASGCTFCGQCVVVCPTGALTAPGAAGSRWLAGRRDESALRSPVLPPQARQAVNPEGLTTVPCVPGVFRLIDAEGGILRIGGVADLRQGVARALEEPTCATVAYFQVELDPLFTQRESELLARYSQEHGHLPVGNDLGDDLFAGDGEDADLF